MMETKKHAACDECRTRKLKCSGHQPKCSRCEREHITCVYSPQKQMGRPRKRRRDDDGQNGHHAAPSTPNIGLSDTAFDPLAYLSPGVLDQSLGQLSFSDPSEVQLPLPLLYANAQAQQHAQPFPLQDTALSTATFPLDPALNGFAPGTTYSDGSHGSRSISAALSPGQALDSARTSNASNPPCACLSSMYLTLSELQGMTDYTFPFALRPIRQATGTAEQVLNCQLCPQDAVGGYLNVAILTSLLFAIAERFRKVVEEITAEAARAQQTGSTKRFQLGDANANHHHLHTGTADCPGRFDIELTAAEWRSMSMKVVKKEVQGADENHAGFVGLVTKLEQRQILWHTDPDKDQMRQRLWGHGALAEANKNADWQCVRQAQHIKQLLDLIPW